MISKNIKIINEFGLHARPAAKLVHLAAKFKSTVQLTYAGETINAKSIMGVMMLAVEQGGIITLTVNGDDENKLMEEIVNLINSGFGEE